LGLVESSLVGTGINDKKHFACFHHRSFFEANFIQVAAHPGAYVNALDRGGIAGEFRVVYDLSYDRLRGRDRNRRKRGCRSLMMAAAQKGGSDNRSCPESVCR